MTFCEHYIKSRSSCFEFHAWLWCWENLQNLLMKHVYSETKTQYNRSSLCWQCVAPQIWIFHPFYLLLDKRKILKFPRHTNWYSVRQMSWFPARSVSPESIRSSELILIAFLHLFKNKLREFKEEYHPTVFK